MQERLQHKELNCDEIYFSHTVYEICLQPLALWVWKLGYPGFLTTFWAGHPYNLIIHEDTVMPFRRLHIPLYHTCQIFKSFAQLSFWADYPDFSAHLFLHRIFLICRCMGTGSVNLSFSDEHLFIARFLISRFLVGNITDRSISHKCYRWSPDVCYELLLIANVGKSFYRSFHDLVHSPSSVENNDVHSPIFSSAVELLFSPRSWHLVLMAYLLFDNFALAEMYIMRLSALSLGN